MKNLTLALVGMMIVHASHVKGQDRARDFGFEFGVIPTGLLNAITDVEGVKVGQVTLIEGESVRTGVTAILPHGGNIFQEKVPAAVYVGNGFGKLAGSTQIQELGNLESPVVLTNTLSVAAALDGIIDFVFSFAENAAVQSVNAVVGETNDGGLNDIRGRHVRPHHVFSAIQEAASGQVAEGNVGAGTGTTAFGFKAGIGTSSRKLPPTMGGYTVGVLVQANFGGVLQIDGLPLGKILHQYSFRQNLESLDGSCMIVVATDAPVDHRNLERIAKRGMMGLARTGGIASNGSGDYVIAFSAHKEMRIPHDRRNQPSNLVHPLSNDEVSGLFLATIEATEEAIANALFAAEDMLGKGGRLVKALPKDQVRQMMNDR
ncbi:L-aminopeptidase/D-esterase [Lunatimonas lonarensis]|uniref:L-aminopeptidase/D-esterase n=1 Tax=Lunatimonas lonarensis TaxID=1232681 RepID=R7ZNQ6_9BACT|nr:P1 family peptidase [Lunatimonas lonarensis]EON75712.1 L-aminopeptidase/D-esterase [Lunatimonas lonarensis]